MKMSESVFESFEAYLKGADYPKGKKKIMQAAVDLISTKSYNGTSTLQIAKHAGLSQATLFKYFKTKEDLLTAILHPVVPGLFGRFFERTFSLRNDWRKGALSGPKSYGLSQNESRFDENYSSGNFFQIRN